MWILVSIIVVLVASYLLATKIKNTFVRFPVTIKVPVFHPLVMEHEEFKKCIEYLEENCGFNSECLYLEFGYGKNPNKYSELLLTYKDLYNIKISQLFNYDDVNHGITGFGHNPGATFWVNSGYNKTSWSEVVKPDLTTIANCWIETKNIEDMVLWLSDQRKVALISICNCVKEIEYEIFRKSIAKSLYDILYYNVMQSERDEVERIKEEE